MRVEEYWCVDKQRPDERSGPAQKRIGLQREQRPKEQRQQESEGRDQPPYGRDCPADLSAVDPLDAEPKQSLAHSCSEQRHPNDEVGKKHTMAQQPRAKARSSDSPAEDGPPVGRDLAIGK